MERLDTQAEAQCAILDVSVSKVLPYLDQRSLTGKRLFITGGTGFFGLWLLSVLRMIHMRGVEVEVTVLSRNPEAFLDRHPQFKDQSWLDFIIGDVRDFVIPSRQFDFLLHAATETSMSAHANSLQMFDDIVFGTRRSLQLAKSTGVSRVLLISSGAVYGHQPPHLFRQPDDSLMACDPWQAGSAYGEGKRVMELMGGILQEETGIACLSARCFSFCGPGIPLDAHFAIGNFIRDAIHKGEITIKGDGTAMRSYLFGADLAVWLLQLLLKGTPGNSYNVGSDEGLSMVDLAHRVRDLLAPKTKVRVLNNFKPLKYNHNLYVPDITRSKSIGCKIWTSLNDSIKITASYYRN